MHYGIYFCSGLGPSFGKKATWIGAGGDQTFIKIDESLITTQMLPKVNIVADKKTISTLILMIIKMLTKNLIKNVYTFFFFSVLIPTIPLSFYALTINRRDGSCAAHYKNQVNFIKMIQANTSSMLEINQNISNSNVALMLQNQQQQQQPQQQHQQQSQQQQQQILQDAMSRSMHEARNQIFELPDNQNMMLADQRKRRKQEHKSSGGGGDKCSPQIAFALDPFYNNLWVFDGGAKKLYCYNVIASEIPIDNMVIIVKIIFPAYKFKQCDLFFFFFCFLRNHQIIVQFYLLNFHCTRIVIIKYHDHKLL